VSRRTRAERCGMGERIVWRFFAPFEFAVTVIVGVLLYVGGALYFAAYIYLTAVSGLFKRASALVVQRFRVGRVFDSGKSGAPSSLSEIVAARRAEQGHAGRSGSWLN